MKFNEAKKILEAINQFDNTVPDLMKIIGNEAQNHFVKSFRNQGFTDDGLQSWKPRKRGKDPGRAILVKTGRLRRSIRKRTKGKYAVSIVSDVPYAMIHNNGGRINKGFNRKILSFKSTGGFAKTRTRQQRKEVSYQQQVTINEHQISMPKRQFIGDSEALARKTKAKLQIRIKRIFK